ncbi:MAG: cardiolipin synthase [Phycisphaerae bacterium]|nr:cardiolipin synthase [Phycisphaerae bacterium]
MGTETLWTILTHVAIIVGFLIAFLFIAHIIRQKRSPSGTIAWLLVILLLPYVGVPLYLLLGGRKMKRRRDRKAHLELRKAHVALPSHEAHVIDRLIRSYELPGAAAGHRVRLCSEGQEGYARLVEMIDGATKSIHIATYVFHPDDVGMEVLDRLTRKAAAGVRVRLLVDGVGSHKLKRRKLKKLIAAGGRAVHFNPIFYRPWRNRMDLRNHRKIVVVDDKIAMAGGTNIAEEYIGPAPKEGRWADLSFVLEGPEVGVYAEIFRLDWEFVSGEALETPESFPAPVRQDGYGAIVQVTPSGPDVPGDPLYDALVSAMFEAQRRVWVVTPYFVPDDTLIHAFRLARHRGVDVRLYIPRKSNQRLTNWARGPYLRELDAAGVSIHFYTPGMMHAKVMLVDDALAVIGSANFDIRSLFLNYEVAMFMYSDDDIAATRQWIETLAKRTEQGMKKAGPVRDLLEGVVRMLSPLL